MEGTGIFRAVTPDGTEKWKNKIGNATWQSLPAIDKNGRSTWATWWGFSTVPGQGRRIFRGGGWTEVDLEVQGQQPVARSHGLARHLRGFIYALHRDEQPHPRHSHGLTALDIMNPACFSSTSPPCNPIRWTFATAGKADETPALAAHGTLYVPAMDGTRSGSTRSTERHPEAGVGPIASSSETSAQPIIGADGVVYVGIKNGFMR